MKSLYIAWQDSQTRLWHTVGQLVKEDDLYRFSYTKGALSSPRFKYLSRMSDLNKNYYSHELFPLFANRILNRSRSEYPNYLQWLALNPTMENDPMQLLARSGGKRATDELSVFAYPEINKQGEMELFFLSHGLRYLDEDSMQRVNHLQTSDRLKLKREDNNSHDRFALLLLTGDPVKVGYCPRYLNKGLCQILEKTTVHFTVERLNLDAPIQFRLLCKANFRAPQGFELFANDEYQLLSDVEAVA